MPISRLVRMRKAWKVRVAGWSLCAAARSMVKSRASQTISISCRVVSMGECALLDDQLRDLRRIGFIAIPIVPRAVRVR